MDLHKKGNDKYIEWYQKNSVHICERIVNVPDFVLRLGSKCLVGETLEGELEQKSGDPMKCAHLFRALVKVGVDRIDDVMECLDRSGNEHITKLFKDFKKSRLQLDDDDANPDFASGSILARNLSKLDTDRIEEPQQISILQESQPTGGVNTATKPQTGIWFEMGHLIGNFTGRQDETETLHTKLDKSHTHKSIIIITISGFGGIGKSTLARNYAFTYKDFYDGNVVWINAETIDSMKASFLRLSKKLELQLGDQPPQEFLVEKVFGYFNDKKCLFIYDNVENLADFKQFRPKDVDPSGQVPYVLITSRRTDLNPLSANEISLYVLTTEEAVELIQKMLPHSRKENAMKLADKLQSLPLALQQALAYIRGTSIGDDDEAILQYLKEFDKSAADLLGDERFRDHNDYSSTFAIWQITLARIREMKDGPLAIKVINALAYLNPDFISTEFLKLVFEQETQRGLKLLERFSIININEGKQVVFHRLVQHVVRLSFSEREEEQLQMLVAAIDGELVKKKLNDLSRECMSHGLHLFPFQMNHTHSEAMTANWDYFVDLCNYLTQYGNYVESLSISQQMASFYESVHGENHRSTIILKWRMAVAYLLVDKVTDSVQILNAILPDAKSVLGIEHSVTMNIQWSLASCLSRTGDTQKAVQIYDEIIPIAERLFGEKGHNVLDFKYSKARALGILGKLDESLELLHYVLGKKVSKFGETDPRTLNTKSQIASVHYEKKEFTKALEIWEEVEAGFTHVLGDAHPHTITVRNNISLCEAMLSQRSSYCHIV